MQTLCRTAEGCMRSVLQTCAAGAARWLRAAPRAIDAANYAQRNIVSSPVGNVLPLSGSRLVPSFKSGMSITSRDSVARVLGVSVGDYCAKLRSSVGGSRSFSAEAAPEAGSAQPSRFAIVGIGGKQYKVVEGDRITTERLIGKEVGEPCVPCDKTIYCLTLFPLFQGPRSCSTL